MQTQTLIIGGGLSGLALAARLAAEGRDFRLVEARDRWGGRILTERFGEGAFDLGPSWFWPGQPRMAALTERLGLTRFDQFYEGDLLYEDETGHVQRGQGFASMQGSWRLRGGMGSLIDALVRDIPEDQRLSATPIRALHRTADGVTARTDFGQEIYAQQVVLTVPLRIAARLSYVPALPNDTIATMESIPTWMAGQAKAVAVYDRPFWRDAGLSGDAMSRFGPMVECHDASPMRGGPYAIFGFIGVPPAGRRDRHALDRQLRAQLSRLFGPEAQAPKSLFVKDWAADPCTATDLDHRPVHAHPDYGLPHVLSRLWDNALILSGTEVAPTFGGFLEGALEAADRGYDALQRNGD
ncbi:flavin monoamine oxidase family protein [Salipiger aestuarii]|uniref:flavin monoamine oxidase family protein n=1 Tax=Salipiger aestuarii TaxID=568098 RepID=UPI0012392BE2|nr:FAD-dependent oxidoreductase [Salipiger aestuarii]KAA8610690.1 amine oxidase [Salipiger aestuarii]